MSDDQEFVPKEFNDANIRAAREYKSRAEAAEARLAEAMDVIKAIFDPAMADDALHKALLKFIKGRKALVGNALGHTSTLSEDGNG